MGKTAPTDDRVHVQLIEFGGRRFVMMEEEQYELLLDAIDAADAERILNDPNARILKWDEIKHEFMRTASRKRRKSPAARKKGSGKSSASKSRQHPVGKSRARS
jgi:hypothetical protein